MASIQMGSETWKKRMGEECRKLLNEELLEDINNSLDKVRKRIFCDAILY